MIAKKGKNCPFRQKGTLCDFNNCDFNNCDYYEKVVCPKLSKPKEIECSLLTGEKRTKVFYCETDHPN